MNNKYYYEKTGEYIKMEKDKIYDFYYMPMYVKEPLIVAIHSLKRLYDGKPYYMVEGSWGRVLTLQPDIPVEDVIWNKRLLYGDGNYYILNGEVYLAKQFDGPNHYGQLSLFDME